MSLKKSSNQKNDKPDNNITLAKIGIITALITVLGVISVPLFNYLSKNKEVSVQATQMAQFINFTAIALTDVAHNTTGVTLIPTSSTPLLVSTETVSPATTIDTPSPTVTPTLIAGQDIQDDCINSSLWAPYTTNLFLSQNLVPQNNCWQALKMGISAQDKGLLLSNQNAAESGIYGIVTSLPQNAIIEFVIKVVKISDGEIKFGIVSDSTPNPNFEGVFMVIRDGGILGLRSASGSDEKNIIAYSIPSYPGTYKFKFDINGLRLNISRDGSTAEYKSMNIPFSTRNLFIGYQVNQTGNIEAYISGLVIQQK